MNTYKEFGASIALHIADQEQGTDLADQSIANLWTQASKGEKAMHVHANQLYTNFLLNALYAAGKVEAKREAERTRKKLLNAASALAGDTDAFVVQLSRDDAGGEQANRQGHENGGKQKDRDANSESAEEPFSGWA